MNQTSEQVQEEFLDSMYLISHSTKTKITYQSALNHFKEFVKQQYNCNETELVAKIKSEELDIYQTLRSFVIYLDKKNIRPQGLRSYVSGIKGYLRHWGIRINSDDYKQLVKIPRITKTREIPLTKEIILRILRNSPPKLQTAILLSCSSGLRIGEIVQLKISDIDFESEPVKINVRAEIAKGGSSRETFITRETTNALKDYLKRYYDWKDEDHNLRLQNTVIFGRTSKKNKEILLKYPVEASKQTLQASLRKQLALIPDLSLKNENGRLAIHFHGFRKYFRTVLGNVCGRDYAEALMGHSFYMDTYYQLSEDKKREMYLEAEPHLTLSDFETVEKNIKKLSEKNNQLEEKFNNLLEYLKENKIKLPNL